MLKLPTEKHITELSKDIFGYKDLSKRLLDEILLGMELPNCFGLYGNWGSGKSTMLHFMIKHLENNHEIAKIYFEPWQYEYSDQKDLLYALLNCIKKQLKIEGKIWKKLLKSSLAIGVGLLRTGANINVQEIAEDLKLLEEKIYEEHELWINEVEKFKSDFQKAIAEGIKKSNAKKLFVIIDDLDRCLPENAVKLLEGIKNFLSVENTLFILAVDRRIMSNMIESKYGLHRGYGDEYLMKIIHYYYELPKVKLAQIVKDIFNTYEIKVEERQEAYIIEFLRIFANEPRKAKHFLHQYCMNISLSSKSKEMLKSDANQIQVQFFFVASFLTVKFPDLFSGGGVMERLKNLSEGARLSTRSSKTEEYNRIIEKDSFIQTSDRIEIEAILRRAIIEKGSTTQQEVMNVQNLFQAIEIIKNPGIES